MKIALMSDVHLEYGPCPIEKVDADVLVLAGDITTADPVRFGKIGVEFFKQASEMFNDVIYIMGNHEHYRGDFALS